jgi:UDP-N-acetylmuramoyl-tripeptide--D-alanyl-D-alanine ligase
MTISQIHTLFLECKSVSIDTRKIENNSFFVAIKGENFDANTFAKEALQKGAKYVIIDNKDYYIDEQTILVENSLKTLQELAKYHREYLKIPIIALTGSNGKTTTKELINKVLEKKYITKATLGNLNNHIGVPLTLLSFDKNTQIGIVEMGANHQKEIEFLCQLAQPDYGYITNFGKAHLEGFGGIEGVIKGKSELYTYLSQNQKTAFVNADDAIQIEKTETINRVTFSQKIKAGINFTNIEANPFVKVTFNDLVINSRLIGLYNATNICAAIAIGTHFDVDSSDIKQAIENYIPTNNRSQIIHKNNNEIILDAYNANPSSMLLALENFLQIDKPNKLIVIGDMFELGNESLAEHKSIVAFLENTTTSFTAYLIGTNFYSNAIQNDKLIFCNNFEDFTNEFSKTNNKNNMILIKGSRGMALERVLELI